MTDSRHPRQGPGPLDRHRNLRAALELWGEPPRFEYTPSVEYTKRLPLNTTKRNQPVPLSPTAQAVFDAAWALPVTLLDAIGDQEEIRRCQIAASLRTAAGCLQQIQPKVHHSVLSLPAKTKSTPLPPNLTPYNNPMPNLSPTTQAAWDAYNDVLERVGVFEDHGDALAAFLRAVMNSVVPESNYPIETPWWEQGSVDREDLRRDILAIATELETLNNNNQ